MCRQASKYAFPRFVISDTAASARLGYIYIYMVLTCENTLCAENTKGECAAASMVRNQARTVGSAKHQKEKLSKNALGMAINAYETTVADKRCHSPKTALRKAITYARKIHQAMPDDPT